MDVETEIEILDGQRSFLFSNEPFEKSSVMSIRVRVEDFDLHFDNNFKSRLFGNGLYEHLFLFLL
jgi:hypothetical protein